MDGYTFDSDGFHGVKQDWEGLANALRAGRADAEKLVATVAPGHEPASGFVAADQNDSGEALRVAIDQMLAFVDSYSGGLAQSEHEYQALEAAGRQTFDGGRR
jgi:hypothetical protein